MEYELNFWIAKFPDNFFQVTAKFWNHHHVKDKLKIKVCVYIDKYDLVDYVIEINKHHELSYSLFWDYFPTEHRGKKILDYYLDTSPDNHQLLCYYLPKNVIMHLAENGKFKLSVLCCLNTWYMPNPNIPDILKKTNGMKVDKFEKIMMELDDELIIRLMKNGNPSKNVLRRYIYASVKRNRLTLAENLRGLKNNPHFFN